MRNETTYPKRGLFNHRVMDLGWIRFEDRLCKRCSSIVPPEDKTCRHCGRKADSAAEKRETKAAKSERGYSVAFEQLGGD